MCTLDMDSCVAGCETQRLFVQKGCLEVFLRVTSCIRKSNYFSTLSNPKIEDRDIHVYGPLNSNDGDRMRSIGPREGKSQIQEFDCMPNFLQPARDLACILHVRQTTN